MALSAADQVRCTTVRYAPTEAVSARPGLVWQVFAIQISTFVLRLFSPWYSVDRRAHSQSILDEQQDDQRDLRAFVDNADRIWAKSVDEEIQQERHRGKCEKIFRSY